MGRSGPLVLSALFVLSACSTPAATPADGVVSLLGSWDGAEKRRRAVGAAAGRIGDRTRDGRLARIGPPGTDRSEAGALQRLAIQETAAHLVALQRLQQRLDARAIHVSEGAALHLPIDGESRVACPHGTTSYMTCLGCRHLAAIRTDPPAIDCVPES